MSSSPETLDDFDRAADEAVQLGNRLINEPDADEWDIASGLLAGAIQFWLYTRQPCGDPRCESCADIATADQRMRQLLDEIREYAEDSEYFHSPNDANVGTA